MAMRSRATTFSWLMTAAFIAAEICWKASRVVMVPVEKRKAAPAWNGCGLGNSGSYCLEPDMTASITRSRLKLPGFWRGGNSLKLWSHLPT